MSRLTQSIHLCFALPLFLLSHLQSLPSDVVLVSPLYVAKPPQSCFLAPLCDVLYLQSLTDVIVSHMVSSVWPHGRVAAWPSAHLHFCLFQFLHVGASDWHCLHAEQHSWLNDRLVYLSFNTWWYSLIA